MESSIFQWQQFRTRTSLKSTGYLKLTGLRMHDTILNYFLPSQVRREGLGDPSDKKPTKINKSQYNNSNNVSIALNLICPKSCYSLKRGPQKEL